MVVVVFRRLMLIAAGAVPLAVEFTGAAMLAIATAIILAAPVRSPANPKQAPVRI